MPVRERNGMNGVRLLPLVAIVAFALFFVLCGGGVLILPLTMLLGGVGQGGQSPQETSYYFGVDPSGKVSIFSRENELYLCDLRTQRVSRWLTLTGQVRDLEVLSDRWAIVSVQQNPKRADSDIWLYRLNLQTREMLRITNTSGVWEQRIRKVSQTKFVFDQFEVKKRLQPLLGWDIYGLHTGTYIGDAGNGSIAALNLDTGSALYSLEQVLSDRKVLLSFMHTDGKRWLIGLLDKGIEEPNPRVVRRVRLKIVAHTAVASQDGRFVYYTQENPASQTTEVYRYDTSSHTSHRIAILPGRVVQLKMGNGDLVMLTDSRNPTVWRVNTRNGSLHRVVHISLVR